MIKNCFLFFYLVLAMCSTVKFAEGKTYESCGVNKSCADGYYCLGATGETDSGVCTANGLNITLCRFVHFVQDDIFKYIALFASVFVGIFLFIGRASSTVIAQVIIGIGLLFGAQQILISMSGDTQEGVCSKDQAKTCIADVDDVTTNVSLIATNIKNLSENKDGFGNTCPPLGCVVAECQGYDVKTNTDSNTNVNTYKCTTNGETKKRIIQYQDGDNAEQEIEPEKSKCPNFKVKCTPVKSPYKVQYLLCKNNCTNEEYGAKVNSNTNITTCKDLALRKV